MRFASVFLRCLLQARGLSRSAASIDIACDLPLKAPNFCFESLQNEKISTFGATRIICFDTVGR